MTRRARHIVLHVGDVLYDETLGDIGVLVERYDGEAPIIVAGHGGYVPAKRTIVNLGCKT